MVGDQTTSSGCEWLSSLYSETKVELGSTEPVLGVSKMEWKSLSVSQLGGIAK